jgi:hypothetical protein
MERPVTRNKALKSNKGTALQTYMSGMGSDVLLARLFLVAVLGAGLVSLLFGPSPESMALFPCPFHTLTGIKCPGCGMTRACIALARGEVGEALRYNPFSLGLLFFVGVFALFPDLLRRFWRSLTFRARTVCTGSMLALILGFWVYRILP